MEKMPMPEAEGPEPPQDLIESKGGRYYRREQYPKNLEVGWSEEKESYIATVEDTDVTYVIGEDPEDAARAFTAIKEAIRDLSVPELNDSSKLRAVAKEAIDKSRVQKNPSI